jgi:hypothetical protein
MKEEQLDKIENILLTKLQERLFKEMDCILDRMNKGNDLEEEIKRGLAFNELAKTAVTNGALMAKCADTLYGLPVSATLPLIPPSPAENPVIVDGKRKALLRIPRQE